MARRPAVRPGEQSKVGWDTDNGQTSTPEGV
jgi:hypothetical protein